MMSGNLFAYGTLMAGEIMASVSGMTLTGIPALLRGYRRYRVYAEVYPGIFPSPRDSVDGLLYEGLTLRAWERLDRFEGEMYERQEVEVELESGRIQTALTYVVRPGFRHRLSDSPWSLDEFLSCGKGIFEEEYQGFAALSDSPAGEKGLNRPRCGYR